MIYRWSILFGLPIIIWITSSLIENEDPKEVLWGFY
jgi:hypothetical protein